MPDPNQNPAPNQQVDLSDAPGGELDLDALFGNPEVQPTTTVSTQPPQTDPQATTPSESEPFLKTATGTVYKSAEDAVRGVEHKDQLIAQLRQQLAQQTGSDPLKRQQASTPSAPENTNYLENQEAYFRDLGKAVEAKDQAKYLDVQRKFVYDALAPLTPTITTLVRTQAASTVEAEIKDFRQFQQSEDYVKTLDSMPMLKNAIEIAESNPTAAGQLPEFYKMAYYVHQGLKLPEIVQAQRVNAPEPVRPTVTSTPVTAPATNAGRVAQPSLNTPEGRKAIIEQQERLGVGDLKF